MGKHTILPNDRTMKNWAKILSDCVCVCVTSEVPCTHTHVAPWARTLSYEQKVVTYDVYLTFRTLVLC